MENKKAVHGVQPRKKLEARKHLLRLISTDFRDKDIEVEISYQSKVKNH